MGGILRKVWGAGGSPGGLNGTNASARAADEQRHPVDDADLGEPAVEAPALEAPVPAEAVADDEAVSRYLAELEGRIAALEAAKVPPAPPKPTEQDPLRPSESSIAEWLRVAIAAGKAAGRWEAPRDVAALVASMIQVPALELVTASEGDAGPTEIVMAGTQPSGPPISLARIVLACCELAAAWSIDLDEALQVAHEDAVSRIESRRAA